MNAHATGLLCTGVLVAAVFATGMSSAAPSASPKPLVWFGPMPAGGPFPDRPGSKDYMALFRRGAPWAKAARRVQVFRIYESFLPSMSTAQLRRIVADLKRRKIDLAVDVLPLRATDCGDGIEGFAGADSLPAMARKIKAAGGTVRYVAFDEPFYFGHLYDGPNACHWSPERVAKELNEYVRELRFFFPKVVAGDIEPLVTGDRQGLVEWMDTYRRVTGKKLPFLHLDLDFRRRDWPRDAHYLQDAARARGIPLGVIYYGGYEATTDAAWIAASEQRTADYEAKEGIRPDHVIFQSWEALPDYVLPETKPSTFTWRINRYFRPRTALTLQVSGETASGSLTDASRKPLPGRRIDLTATPLDGPGAYAEYTLSGTVPADAVTADVGYRVNTECGCSGKADFTLHEVRYQEGGGPNRVPNPRFDQGLDGWSLWGEGQAQLKPSGGSGQALHVTVSTGQVAAINSARLPVTASVRFTLTFAARVAPASAGSGYFDIVFLRNDIETTRSTIGLEASPIALGNVVTGTQGSFRAELGSLPSGSHLLEAWFRGGSNLFPSYAASRAARG